VSPWISLSSWCFIFFVYPTLSRVCQGFSLLTHTLILISGPKAVEFLASFEWYSPCPKSALCTKTEQETYNIPSPSVPLSTGNKHGTCGIVPPWDCSSPCSSSHSHPGFRLECHPVGRWADWWLQIGGCHQRRTWFGFQVNKLDTRGYFPYIYIYRDIYIYMNMSHGLDLIHNAIDRVFLPRSPVL